MSAGLYGQATYGNIIGTVTDTSQAVVPGAKVTITSQDRGQIWPAVTNASGNYSQTHLQPGRYTVVVEADGFQRWVRHGVEVGVGRSIRVDAGP